MTKKCLSKNAREGHAFTPCSLFPASVTCCRWATSLDHISGVAVMADIGMKCTQEQNLSLFWHPAFTVTVAVFGLSWGGVGRHASAMLTLRNCHIFSEACQSLQDAATPVYAVNHASAYAGYRACKRIQPDWLADIYDWSHTTNSQSVPVN